MAKGYWVVRLEVRDVERFGEYLAATPRVLEQYGGKFLARGGAFEAVEGVGWSRNSIVEFPSYQAALECYRSHDYQVAKRLREGAVDMEITVLEGTDPSTPL